MASEKSSTKSMASEKSTASEEKMIITLRSSDGETFEVEEDVAVASQTIKNMVEDGCAGSVIPLPNVTSKTLTRVIEYCRKHAGDGDGDKSKEEEEAMNKWDKEFAKVDHGTLFDIIMAANYLHIKGLLDLTCNTVADKIKSMTVEEIRAEFHIENDYTPEEEEAVRRENAWAYE